MAKPWSDAEDQAIKDAYPALGKTLEIEGKSEGAIRQRAHVLGVKFNPAESKLAENGLDPGQWEPVQAWAKTSGASIKYRPKAIEWRSLLSGLNPPRVPKIPEPGKPSGLMLEVAEVDAHFGKHAWAPETGWDYDLKIAVDSHRQAALDFASRMKGERFDRVLVLGGQDCLHIANPEGTTSAGTHLDFDSRFQKIVKSRIEYEVWRIDLWSKFGPVEYVSNPGNHSFVAETMLAEVVRWARPGVAIHDSPKDRQYLRFGQVALGFSHGDKTKPAKARELFAAEAPAIWGSTTFREFHTGHLHAESANTGPGCTNRVLKALCPPDRWHSDSGYIALPGTQAFVWDRDKGLRRIEYA